MSEGRSLRVAAWGSSLLLVCPFSGARAQPLQSYDFFRTPEIADVKLNTSGDLFTALFTEYAITTVRVSDSTGTRSADIHRFPASGAQRIQLLEWTGDRTLIVLTSDGKVYDVIRVHLSPTGMSLESSRVNWPGLLVHSLRSDEGHVLWSPYGDLRSVHRVSLEALASPADGRSPFRRSNRVTRMDEPVRYWRCDRHGTPRLAGVEDSRG